MTLQPLPTHPDRVSYAWYPTTVHPGRGLVPGQVYWLDDLVARTPTPGQVARIEADSAALALPQPTLVESTPAVEQADGEVPKVVTEGVWKAGAARPRRNALSLSGTGVGAARVLGAAAGLRADRTLEIQLTSDGAMTVDLALAALGTAAPSPCAQVQPTAAGARISIPSGTCRVTFGPGAAPPKAAASPTARQPAGCGVPQRAARRELCAPRPPASPGRTARR
jgi:hypothetical protein